MKKIFLLLGCAFVGVLVALTYFGFETAVHSSINLVWNTTFNTEAKRFLVIPICLLLTIVFFAMQHFLDPKSENHESHGLGGAKMQGTLLNFATILVIGYFSLVAGASLGPEAVLVPACMVIGAFVADKLFKNQGQAIGALSAAAIVALFAAFFHSFVIGFLAVFLVTKQAKVKLSPQVALVAIIASLASFATLLVIDPKSQYFSWPDYNWTIRLEDVLIALALMAAGYISTFALKNTHTMFEKLHNIELLSAWWLKALIAGGGLGILYLLGGPLVEFTGNQSIEPLFEQAASLGVLGLVWIYIVKLLAIGWSKSMGYRGGLVFPMIFVASVLVALATMVDSETNFMLGLMGAMVGVLLAERKAKILF